MVSSRITIMDGVPLGKEIGTENGTAIDITGIYAN